MKKYFVFLVLYLFSNALLFSQFSFPGEGTEAYPYELWTKEHLEELGDSIVAYVEGPRDTCGHCYQYFKLMQNIDNIEYRICGYGLDSYFDGNDKIIAADEKNYNGGWFFCAIHIKNGRVLTKG